MNWFDSFPEERPGESARVSSYAAVCSAQLRRMGTEGFANWLTVSFGGSEPHHEPGAFMYDGPGLFCEEFRLASAEFAPAVRDVARVGFEAALANFNQEHGAPFGLLEIFGAAENVDENGAATVESVSRILRAWFPPAGRFRRTIETQEDIVILREILESAFRRLWSMNGRQRLVQRHFYDIARWADDVFEHWPKLWILAPAFAPLYIIALAKRDGDWKARRARNENILRVSSLTRDHPFPALYEYTAEGAGQQYPYQLEGLLELGERFLQASEELSPPGSARPRNRLGRIVQTTGRPPWYDRGFSATAAIAPAIEMPAEQLTAICEADRIEEPAEAAE